MDFHGITTQIIDNGSRSVALPSSSVIGLTDTYTPGPDFVAPHRPVKITSLREAAQAFGIGSQMFLGCEEILKRTSAAISCVGVPHDADPDHTNQQIGALIGGVNAAGVRTGLHAQIDAQSKLGLHPRLLAAPGWSRNIPVATEMDGLASRLQAMAILDGPDIDDDAAIQHRDNFGSKRLYMVDAGGIYRTVQNGNEILRPASAAVAGMFAYTDSQYGYWASPSNQLFVGINGTGRDVEFLENDPDCRANLLNKESISTIIRLEGMTLWGNRTLSRDPKWSFVTRVRTLDILMGAVQRAHRSAVDRSLNKTYVSDVTRSVNNFINDQKKLGAVINFEVYPDPDLNTVSAIEDGKCYWNIRLTDVPPAENPIFRFEVTNEWMYEILGSASAGAAGQ